MTADSKVPAGTAGHGLRDGWQRLTKAAPDVFFWYTRLSGVLSILAFVSSDLIQRLGGIWALQWIYYLGFTASLPYGVLLILLSMGVRRRKKAAWRILMLLFGGYFAIALLVVGSLAADPDRSVAAGELVTVVAYAAVLTLLAAARPEFNALPDRANRRLALAVFSGLLVVSGLLGTGLVTLMNRDPDGRFLTDALYVVLQTVGGPGVTGEPINVDVPTRVNLLLGVLGTGLLIITFWALFRPGHRDAVLSPAEELTARRLLAEYGEQDSLGYFALRRDKNVIVAPNGKAAISYLRHATRG